MPATYSFGEIIETIREANAFQLQTVILVVEDDLLFYTLWEQKVLLYAVQQRRAELGQVQA